MKDVYVFIDDIMIEAEPDESIRPKREVVGVDQITKYYWTYGGGHHDLKKIMNIENSRCQKSKSDDDLNLHLEIKDGNNGKMMVLEIAGSNGENIILREMVSDNKVIFNETLKK